MNTINPAGTAGQAAACVCAGLKPRVLRLQALAELAATLPPGECGLPAENCGTDDADRLAALLHCLCIELEALRVEVGHD